MCVCVWRIWGFIVLCKKKKKKNNGMHGYEVSELSIQFYNISIKYVKFLLLHDVRSSENSQNVKHFQVFYANILKQW